MINLQKSTVLLIALAVIVATIFYLEAQKPERFNADVERKEITLNKSEKEELYPAAVELVRPSGFINTEPFELAGLIGEKVILFDFWTYSCINCQRTLPYLNAWYDKYKDQGFEIVGVHTPEFEFESKYENVLAAVAKYNVEYPVVLDNEYATWRAYGNRYWPRKYLIDIDGFIVYDHIGEGAYEETEEKIVELLNERARVLDEREVTFNMTAPSNAQTVDFSKINTRETYLGYARLENIANLPSEDCFDGVCDYQLNQELPANFYGLKGTWRIGPEQAHLVSETGSILINFSASKVNLVAGPGEDGTFAEIYLDGKKVDGALAGADVEGGRVNFTSHDLYNLVDLRGNYERHTLEIKIFGGGFEAFAFTFG